MVPTTQHDPRAALTTAAQAALAYVAARARATGAEAEVAAWIARAGEPAATVERVCAGLWQRARVALHLHPDRLLADGTSVAEGLLATGRYRSQFETHISNGSRTAFPGGERELWEARLFGGAYAASGPEERPRYGALHALGHADGPAPRFGSCYLVLAPEVAERCTFAWGDSHTGPEHVGTRAHFAPVLAAWLACAATTGAALGVALGLASLVRALASEAEAPLAPERGRLGRALDDYVEAEVHGDVELARDATALVVDPSFDGTPTGRTLEALAARSELALHRHPGFVLAPADVPDDFRGPRMPALAARVAAAFASTPGELDAATIGRAAASLEREPGAWADCGPDEESLQHLKQLWHVVVRFGRARGSVPVRSRTS
ncbi:MAG: DUF3626 domain-containing protein [Myxococcales bacterium]|nr:DUF3626 domain-containing protein [Myxococcales bacterium]